MRPAADDPARLQGVYQNQQCFEISELMRSAIRAWGTDAAAEARPPKQPKGRRRADG
jgi:hypothetical protein